MLSRPGLRKKLFVSAVIGFGLILCHSTDAQVTTSISSGSALAGQSVVLNVTSQDTGSTAPAALQWSMNYPAADISSVSVAVGPSASAAGKTVACSSGASATTCVVYGMNQNSISSGIIAQATVQLASAPVDQSIAIGISGVVASDPTGSAITDTGAGGTVTVTPALPQVGVFCTPTMITTPASVGCSVSLSGVAGASGFPLQLASNDAALQVPASVVIPAGASSEPFTATASTVSISQSAAITATGGSNSPSVTLSLVPPPPQVNLWCAAATVSTPGSLACNVNVSSAAASATAVTLTSNNANLQIPAFVTIQSGATAATFTAIGSAVSATQTATVTASAGGSSTSLTLTLVPPPPTVSLSCAATTVKTPGSVECSVTLSVAATGPGESIRLVSNDTALQVPASLLLPAGASMATFTATASVVSTTQTATVSAIGGSNTPSVALSLVAAHKKFVMRLVKAG